MAACMNKMAQYSVNRISIIDNNTNDYLCERVNVPPTAMGHLHEQSVACLNNITTGTIKSRSQRSLVRNFDNLANELCLTVAQLLFS